ncbi:MAG: NUDIX domain-containing protein [Alkalispirochaeta sp.]
MTDTQLHFCPRCGHDSFRFDGKNRFSCDTCGFVYYQNTATGCGAILTLGVDDDLRVLLLQRAKDPARGALDFPGGFVDPGESAEIALTREIREETGLEVTNLTYLHSAPNRYEYRDVLYHTCDLVFTGVVASPPSRLQKGEVSRYLLLRPEEIRVEDIAFPSLREAMTIFLSRHRTGGTDGTR